MAFKDFPGQQQGIQLLQRSLERGRLGHGYLFSGPQLESLEAIARTLAKTLNCAHPARKAGGPTDCCDACIACRKIEHGNHPDVHWVRPESKSRVITIDQMREVMREIYLKPTEAEYKVCVVVAADRLNEKAANAFLKTLEEPPARSILILLTAEPQRLIETIVSRCLRLNFPVEGVQRLPTPLMDWLASFSEAAAQPQKSLLGRYRLLDVLVRKLTEAKETIQETLKARSPIEQYKDAEKDLLEKWEEELTAAIEAEYRRQRSDLLTALQWWLRDVWLRTLARGSAFAGNDADLLSFPDLAGSLNVAQRISTEDALENLRIIEQLHRWLGTNVQEALALEVGLLKLKL